MMFSDLSIIDAAEHVGLNETTFRRLVKEGKGPKARRDGRTLRFLPEHLTEWVEEFKRTAYTDVGNVKAKPAAVKGKAKTGKGNLLD